MRREPSRLAAPPLESLKVCDLAIQSDRIPTRRTIKSWCARVNSVCKLQRSNANAIRLRKALSGLAKQFTSILKLAGTGKVFASTWAAYACNNGRSAAGLWCPSCSSRWRVAKSSSLMSSKDLWTSKKVRIRSRLPNHKKTQPYPPY